jgi:hypothetical protein
VSVRVGVSGHRLNQLPEGSREAVSQRLAEALELVEAACGVGVLVSPLAEGADRFAAHAGLARGWPLQVLLPFSQQRYEQDFPEAHSVAEFRLLLAQAQSVEALDGEGRLAAGEGEAAPYAALGGVLLTRIDFLLAVWTGAPKRGPGGTAEVIENALAAGKAALWLTPDGADGRLLLPALQRPQTAEALLRAAQARWPAVEFPRSSG